MKIINFISIIILFLSGMACFVMVALAIYYDRKSSKVMKEISKEIEKWNNLEDKHLMLLEQPNENETLKSHTIH